MLAVTKTRNIILEYIILYFLSPWKYAFSKLFELWVY